MALSLNGQEPTFRHEAVTAGASQLLLPWVEAMLEASNFKLGELDAIAVGIGPGAFTGVRLGVAAAQGLAISQRLLVIPVASLDAIAAQVIQTPAFQKINPKHFMIAVDARMDEVYWAKYEKCEQQLPVRIGNIHLSKPEDMDLTDIQYLAGSAIKEYGERVLQAKKPSADLIATDADITISAIGILDVAIQMQQEGRSCDVHDLELLYIRDKVALTTVERMEAFK